MAFLSFLKPVGGFLLKFIIQRAIVHEDVFGAGRGDEKAAEVSEDVRSVAQAKGFSLDFSLVPALIDAIVKVLNDVGALDSVPGFALNVPLDELLGDIWSVIQTLRDIADGE